MAALTRLDESTLTDLTKALNEGPMTISEFRTVLEHSVPDAEHLTEALIAFNAWRTRKSQTVAESLPALLASLGDNLGDSDIRDVLDARASVLLAKSGDLEYAHANVAQNMRIITDVRPLFGDNPDPEILASVISHQLVVTALKNDELRDIYIALDAEDLDLLGEQVERAKKKDVKVRAMLNLAGIAVADWDGKD